jgi:hypothetical protein
MTASRVHTPSSRVRAPLLGGQTNRDQQTEAPSGVVRITSGSIVSVFLAPRSPRLVELDWRESELLHEIATDSCAKRATGVKQLAREELVRCGMIGKPALAAREQM